MRMASDPAAAAAAADADAAAAAAAADADAADAMYTDASLSSPCTLSSCTYLGAVEPEPSWQPAAALTPTSSSCHEMETIAESSAGER